MPYVDGYVIPIPQKNLKDYRRMAQKAAKIWREHGALDYKECVGEDLKQTKWSVSFSRMMKLKPGETRPSSLLTSCSNRARIAIVSMQR